MTTASAERAVGLRGELAAGLKELGIRHGDVVYVQTCRAALRSPDGAPDDGELARQLCGALQTAVGDSGTILVPTFTFSFCRQEPFDPASTPTISGPWNDFIALAEHVRTLPGAVRSADPIFSTAGIGPSAQEILASLPPVCLGADCVHDRLRRAGGKICILGVGMFEAIYRHHVEAIARVPWRYDKLFTGEIREHGRSRREGWIYNVRIRAENGDPAGEALEALARERGICRSAPVGSAELLVVEAQALHDLAMGELQRDPWFTARGPAGDPVAIEAARTESTRPAVTLPAEASMDTMIDALWRLPRDIVSDGYDAALDALASQVSMTVHEFPTGAECWTWLIPEKWTCREAYLETLDGRRLFSYADHPLHVVSYSLPFDGIVSRAVLLEHLHVHPTLPDAVPFIFKYYDRDWGLCCSRDLRDSLAEDQYRVVIRSDFSFGTLKVGEVVLPGESEESVVLCAHLCHPHMVNDDLCGVVVGIDVMRALARRPRRRFTYRLVIVPETIGSVAYLSANEALIPRMRGGLFLEMLGSPHPHALQHAFDPTTQIDRCFSQTLAALAPDAWTGDFRTVIGNDERQYNAPGVRVPMLSLSRVLPPGHSEYPYREYHSSSDRPETVSPGALEGSRDLVLAMLDAHERNRVPVNLFKGEVFMARYGLFVNWYADPAGHRALFNVLFLVDGTRTPVDIAGTAGLPLPDVHRTLDELHRHGLIEYRDVPAHG